MDVFITGVVTVLAALIAAVIGYRAALNASAQQIMALEKSTSEQIAHLKEQLKAQKEELEIVMRQLDVSAVGMTSSELTAIDELLIQYPRFRAYFYDGVETGGIEQITYEDKERVKAIAARLVNGYATILLQSRKSPGSMQFDTAWVNATIARRYGNSPSCCNHLMSYIEEYAVTGEHQIKLMLKGLNDALKTAKLKNDQEKVERLAARLTAVETAQEGILNKLRMIRERDVNI
jgi:predicted phage tail protein